MGIGGKHVSRHNCFARSSVCESDTFPNGILPGMQSQAVAQGAFGGSRQAVQQGQAGAAASGQIADSLARASLQERGQTMNAQLQARGQDLASRQASLSFLPTASNQLQVPGQIQQQIGAQQQFRSQQEINAARERFDFNQNRPELALDRLANRASFQGGTNPDLKYFYENSLAPHYQAIFVLESSLKGKLRSQLKEGSRVAQEVTRTIISHRPRKQSPVSLRPRPKGPCNIAANGRG